MPMPSKLHAGLYKEDPLSLSVSLQTNLGVENGGILILGSSGEGKSSAGQSLAYQYVRQGIPVFGIDLNQTMSPSHICPQLQPKFEDVAIRHDLYQHPVPSGLIRPLIYDNYIEDSYDTAYGLSEIIGQNKSLRLGPAQVATLADAIQPLVEYRNICPQIFPGILDELEKSSSVNVRRLAKRLVPLLHHNVFECRQDGGTSLPLSPHIHIFDLSNFPSGIKKTLAELLLYDWFRAARVLHTPFCIMIDEVQNLSVGPNSILGQIISEGRKFGIGTILLSQTLKGFSPEERVCLSQSRYRLVFRPPMAEIRSFAEMLSDPQHRAETLELLKSLNVGQCLLSGPVYIGDDSQPCTDCIKITVDLSKYD